MATKVSKKVITAADAYAPPVPTATATIRNPQEPLTVYADGTILLPKQLTHDNTAREVKLVQLAKELKPDFEGIETEDNWTRRETNIIVLRKLTQTDVPQERTALYVSTFRVLIDGIVKSATSLRTSLSLHGTSLIEEAARAVGPGLDQTFDILWPPLEKQSLTKPATAQAANNAIITLITHLSFHHRILESISGAMESKNKGLRAYTIGWLEALIKHCGRTTLDPGVELIEKVLRKGLSDADGPVREKSRVVFWTFSAKWKTRGDL
jgi:CLIP-associating protein 1/2